MATTKSLLGVGLTLALVLVGCQSPSGPGARDGAASPPVASGTKRLTAAVQGQVESLYPGMVSSGVAARTSAMQPFVNAGLTLPDDQGNLHPQVAEQVPTLENGLWKTFPDGRMETTFTIRDNAQWQDGVPLITDDLLFTLKVWQDPALPLVRTLALAALESVQALDRRTVKVVWSKPFIYADGMFGASVALPLPRHVLASGYLESTADFINLPFWTEEYVGAGPFKLREWVPGSYLLLEANERYVAGRPTLDEIEVTFIPDSSTLAANILANAVGLTLAPTLSLEEAVQVRDQWRTGRLELVVDSWIVNNPQLYPGRANPAIVQDVQFRRALLHAVNRQEMADTLMLGLTSIAHSHVSPQQPEHPLVEASIVRYEYDPQRATQIIQSLRYQKSPDGLFRNVRGEKLELEFRTSGVFDINKKSMLSVTEYWQRIGVAVEPVIIPTQRARDAEYRATFPAFEIQRYPIGVERLSGYHSREARVPELRYIGSSYTGYTNPEWDALLDRFFSTVERRGRAPLLREIIRHMTDQLVVLPIMYEPTSFLVTNRLAGYTSGRPGWNAYQWQLQ